jgi:phospholipase/carboxylesterase
MDRSLSASFSAEKEGLPAASRPTGKPVSHAHCFHPGTEFLPPLVLLHGSGGDEHALVPLAAALSPGAARLGVRGTVAIDGGYAFFERFPDRRVNEADVAARVPALAEFIAARGFGRPVAVGYSNGAIMAAALLLARPGVLAGAVLFRPLAPFTHDLPHRLDAAPVLIIDGDDDDRRARGDGLRLAERLERAGAIVTHHVLPTGHAITADDQRIARNWLHAIQNIPPP